MHDLVYCINVSALFNIFLCLKLLLEVPPVQREPALHRLHGTCNLFHLHSEVMDQHSHMSIMAYTYNNSADLL